MSSPSAIADLEKVGYVSVWCSARSCRPHRSRFVAVPKYPFHVRPWPKIHPRDTLLLWELCIEPALSFAIEKFSFLTAKTTQRNRRTNFAPLNNRCSYDAASGDQKSIYFRSHCNSVSYKMLVLSENKTHLGEWYCTQHGPHGRRSAVHLR